MGSYLLVMHVMQIKQIHRAYQLHVLGILQDVPARLDQGTCSQHDAKLAWYHVVSTTPRLLYLRAVGQA